MSRVRHEPSWARTIQLALVLAVMIVALLVTGDDRSLLPLSGVALGVLRWDGRAVRR